MARGPDLSIIAVAGIGFATYKLLKDWQERSATPAGGGGNPGGGSGGGNPGSGGSGGGGNPTPPQWTPASTDGWPAEALAIIQAAKVQAAGHFGTTPDRVILVRAYDWDIDHFRFDLAVEGRAKPAQCVSWHGRGATCGYTLT